MRQQEPEAAAYAAPMVRKQRWMLILSPLPPLYLVRDLSLPISRMGLPSPHRPFQISPKHTQRRVSYGDS